MWGMVGSGARVDAELKWTMDPSHGPRARYGWGDGMTLTQSRCNFRTLPPLSLGSSYIPRFIHLKFLHSPDPPRRLGFPAAKIFPQGAAFSQTTWPSLFCIRRIDIASRGEDISPRTRVPGLTCGIDAVTCETKRVVSWDCVQSFLLLMLFCKFRVIE